MPMVIHKSACDGTNSDKLPLSNYKIMASELLSAPCEKCSGVCLSTGMNHRHLNSKMTKRIKDLQHPCVCANDTSIKNELQQHKALSRNASKKDIREYINQDIYFYDLYITSNNFHQDLPTRKAI